MGGKKDGNRISGCHEYNYKEKWIKSYKGSLSAPRSGMGVVVVNELIYVIGGNNGSNALNQFEVFNQIKQTWKKLKCMAEKRDELAAVYCDDKIYILGGSNGSQCLSSCERYILSENRWEFMPSMRVSRRAFSAVNLPDGIYAIGGFNGSHYLMSVERFDEQANQWNVIAQLNQARCNFSALSTPDNQYIYVFGGFDQAPLDSVEKYSIVNNIWEVTTPLLNKRFMHCTFIAQKN